ncbi:hypothetical protein [Halogranum amylolyticum]|nr:hypothetical protein [Halogranum amylolyticum]
MVRSPLLGYTRVARAIYRFENKLGIVMELKRSAAPITGAAGNISPEIADEFVGEESHVRSHADLAGQTVQTVGGQPEVKN